mgnify:CR=1 FL=1
MELENKPEGGEKEKQAPEQKPAMTYAEFKAQKGRKRGKNRGTGMNKDLAVKIAAVCGGVVVPSCCGASSIICSTARPSCTAPRTRSLP